ncbi:Cytochrome P450 3A41 [Colletotrichum chlorophyti]|uniref:Cytochrome P450 3A41 n=1 Tax=Colletotrichum chlorophyti TaxID=708187 RepID=A0A1Q8RXG3_9PEZI|nr:Cytochrome P450 3A41 [Colletotrichum chlorophyti]
MLDIPIVNSPTPGLGILTTLATALSVFLYSLYKHLLPKPIPGIPYNKEATKTLFGDIPRILKESPNEIFAWVVNQSVRYRSPLFQVFLGPFQKPSVVLLDFREGQDILMRRKEFDRSDFTIDVLGGDIPSFHINLKTGPEWKAHRRLLQDLMTPAFLHNVAAPNIYKSALNLLELWKHKASVANGVPFLAEEDIFYAALDAVFDFGFGDAVSTRALIPQDAKIKSLSDLEVQQLHNAVTNGTALAFPEAPIHPAFAAMLESVEHVTGVAESGFPKLAWLLTGLKPSVRRVRAIRDDFLKEQILGAAARLKIDGENHGDNKIKSAIELMVQKENVLAHKDGRHPVYWCNNMRDETLGFIVAGHDTTSTTLCWGVKFISDNPNVQKRLLETLHSVYTSALTEKRLPSHTEITGSSVAYLDAVVEEMLRLAHTAIIQERQCKEDTIILGHHIPKGTNLIIPNIGPSFTEPGHPIDESLRSPSCQLAAKEHGVRVWDEENMGKFMPERWLVKNEKGEEVFSLTAGPNIPFGLGLRGCFGRKLAYMELKLLTTLLVWAFEFQRCPEALSSYDAIETLTRKPLQCYASLKVRE